MLEGIFKLLRLEAVLAVAMVELLLKASIWLVRLLSRSVPSKAHQPAEMQPELQSAQPPAPPVSSVPAARPTVQPVVYPPPVLKQPDPPPQPSSGGRRSSQTKAVLNAPDHGIWVAGMDDFIRPHPRAEDLLEMLDRMIFVAAHSDGDPFSIPSVDQSPQSTTALPTLRVDDGFDDVPLRALPAPDGKPWRVAAGLAFEPMPHLKPRPPTPKLEPPAVVPPRVELALLEEDDVFLAGHAIPLPDPDGQLWQVARGGLPSRLPSRRAPGLARAVAP